MQFEAIGFFHCREKYPGDAARQPAAAGDNPGYIDLLPGRNYEQALADLDGFSRIWILFAFHQNSHWKPVVQPPRGTRKAGLFATRAPYRPNPIGLSCVRLKAIRGLQIEVEGHDLLDGTPILDIKPYIPYADAFPDAARGWLDEVEAAARVWHVQFEESAETAVAWLEKEGGLPLRRFLEQQLADNPFHSERKRVREAGDGRREIAYRTWRAVFSADSADGTISIEEIFSGYSAGELEDGEDPYADKALHRSFLRVFGGRRGGIAG
jgi:tRNA (adenine37-N6)-methyltransferase